MIGADRETFAECAAFYRDTVLKPDVLDLYQVGILFREPTYCDCTYKFGGFAGPHRYLIISSSLKCLDAYSQHPEWGLCIGPRNRVFKVIGRQERGGKAQVTLLEIPEDLVGEFTTRTLSEMEAAFAEQAAESFEAALDTPPLAEHSTRIWLERLECPVGVDDNGHFFQAWQAASQLVVRCHIARATAVNVRSAG